MSKDLLLKVFEKAKQKQIMDKDFISFIESIFPDKSNDGLLWVKIKNI